MNGRCGRWTGEPRRRLHRARRPQRRLEPQRRLGHPPQGTLQSQDRGLRRRLQGEEGTGQCLPGSSPSPCPRAAPARRALPHRGSPRRAGVSSVQQRTGAGGGRSWHTRGDTGMPGPGPPVTSPPLPGRTLRFPTLPRGLGPPLGPPPTRGGPSPPRHSHSGATPAPGRHRTLTRAADTKRRPRVPAMLPTHRHGGRTRRPGGGARRGPHGAFITAAAHRRRRATPGPPGGRGRGRMQQCDTVKRGRGDTGRGRTRGGAQPPTRTGRPGSGKGEKRDSYFL